MDVQTGGCPCTLGPVLNAGGVVQSQKSWRRGGGAMSEGGMKEGAGEMWRLQEQVGKQQVVRG